MPGGIAEQIPPDIRSGHVAPGAVLQPEALAERFDASRQPVRMAPTGT